MIMTMNKYEHLLYKRGFLFTDRISELKFKDKLTAKIFKKWSHINFKHYNVYLEPSLQHAYYENKERAVLIIGVVINPFSSENDIKIIAKKLAEHINEYDFLDYIDELSGRFTIISYSNGKTFINGDAAGTRTLYYDIKSDGDFVSTHSSLIADLMGYNLSEDAIDVLTNKSFRGRKYLP